MLCIKNHGETGQDLIKCTEHIAELLLDTSKQSILTVKHRERLQLCNVWNIISESFFHLANFPNETFCANVFRKLDPRSSRPMPNKLSHSINGIKENVILLYTIILTQLKLGDLLRTFPKKITSKEKFVSERNFRQVCVYNLHTHI